MSKLVRVFFIATLLSLVLGAIALADDNDLEVTNHQNFRSGGALSPDPLSSSPGPSSPTGIGRPPRVGPNVRANVAQVLPAGGLFGRSETTVAASADGLQVVAGWNDAQGFCGPPFGVACTPQTPSGLSGYAFSTNGGITWTDGGAPPVISNIFTRGDPWLDRGGANNNIFFYANLAVHATTGADLGVSVHRGHFTGSNFTWDDVHVFNAPGAQNSCAIFGFPGTAACDFYDKEALAADKQGGNSAYVSLTNFIARCGFAQFGFGQIEVWRTHDGGNSWQGPVIVSPDVTFITNPSNPNCGFTGVLQQSSAPAIGPNGEVYVAWQFGPTFNPGTSTGAEIRVARSLNGGLSFNSPGVTVASINSMRENTPVGYNRNRINDHPRIDVATSGPHRGRVYVTYASAVAAVTAAPTSPCPAPLTGSCKGQRLTSSQVFVKFSDDQGLTWSAPIPVAPAPPSTGVKRWWPVVTVEPGGNVDVVYYESLEQPVASGAFCTIGLGGTLRRRGTANSLVNTFWAQSTNGGASFNAPVQVSTATSNWCTAVSNIRPNFGDYIGSASGGNHLFPVWADSRNGVPDVFHADILGAGKSQ